MELPFLLTSILPIVIPVILFWMAWQLLFPSIHPDKKNKIPSYCSATTMELIKAFCGTDSPFFILEKAKEMGSPKVFSARIPLAWRVMFVADQEIARDILTDPTTTKPPAIYSSSEQMSGGKSILSLTSNGKLWRDRRKGSAHAFASAHIKRMSQCCAKLTERWIEEILKPSIEADQAIDVPKEMVRITLQVVCSTAFEYEISNAECDKFVHEFKVASREYVMKQGSNPPRKLAFWLPEVHRARQAAKYMQDLSLGIIQAHRNNPLASKDTLIDCIVRNPCYKDDNDRAADITLFLIAGHDSGGNGLAWILLFLAKHPDEMKKLRMELLKCSSPDDWSSCTRLQNVIRESYRIMPTFSMGSIRTAGRDFEYKDIFIPKGTVLFLCELLLGRNPTVFEQPDEYIPDRWNDATPEQLKAVMPFSVGQRNCVGQSLAQAELNHVIASLVLDYDWEVVRDGKPEFTVSMKPAGAKLRATPLSSKS